MNKKLGIAICFASCLLGSCSSNQTRHNESEYIMEINVDKDKFRILQLTDIHLSSKDDQDKHFDFLSKTINDANADLIVCTGDLFTFADKVLARRFFSFLDSFKIHWTVTFGNHDEQCYFSIDWLTEYLNNLTKSGTSYCLFNDIAGDDVFGYANFVINLKKNNDVFYQVIVLDSNRYDFSQIKNYDYIKQDQIDWYKRMVDYSTQTYSHVVPSLCYFHIGLPEFKDAWLDYESRGKPTDTGESGEKNDAYGASKVNSGFFDVLVDKGSTKAVFVGHDHTNNFKVLYKGIWLVYGVHSTNRIYYSPDMLGGRVCEIDTSSLELKHEEIYHTYEELK